MIITNVIKEWEGWKGHKGWKKKSLRTTKIKKDQCGKMNENVKYYKNEEKDENFKWLKKTNGA